MTEEILEETALAPSELIRGCSSTAVPPTGCCRACTPRKWTPELLDELHDTLWPIETGTDAGDTGNRLITTYLSGIWENTLTELAADYMRTFFGHGYSGHAAAYPFESVYSSEKRLLMQSARDEVLALYRAAGLSKQESWKEGEDHIALELEYLQILSDRTAEALCKGDTDTATSWVRAQYNFLDVHLDSWAPLLTAEVKKFAKTDFYRGLAFLTEGFLETDRGCWKSCSRRTSVRAGRARRAGPLSRGEDMETRRNAKARACPAHLRPGRGRSRRASGHGRLEAGARGGTGAAARRTGREPACGVVHSLRALRGSLPAWRAAATSRTASSPCAPHDELQRQLVRLLRR